MSKRFEDQTAEHIVAEEVDPKTYLLVRLNAAHAGREVLPAEEGWRANTLAQKARQS